VDHLCTLMENQSQNVTMSHFLKVSVMLHLFTKALPVPEPIAKHSECIWQHGVEQVDSFSAAAGFGLRPAVFFFACCCAVTLPRAVPDVIVPSPNVANWARNSAACRAAMWLLGHWQILHELARVAH
jgi:hypothetical protein